MATDTSDRLITRLLLHDVLATPRAVSRGQQFWLGAQKRAAERVSASVLDARPGPSRSSDTDIEKASYESLLAHHCRLVAACAQIGVSPPSISSLTSELLKVRRGVYSLTDAQLWQLLGVAQDDQIEQGTKELCYDVAEDLCGLTDAALDYIAQQQRESGAPPSPAFLADYLVAQPSREPLLCFMRRQQKLVRDTLAVSYLGYAMQIARGYIGLGVDYADLVQEGFIGLLKAADHYDYRVHLEFQHYAPSWIWQSISRTVADQGRMVRLPIHIHEKLRHLENAYQSFYDDHDRPPSAAELTSVLDGLGITNPTNGVENEDQESEPESVLGTKRAAQLMAYIQDPVSLNLPLPRELLSARLDDTGGEPRTHPRLFEVIVSVDLSELQVSDADSSLSLLRREIENILNTLSAREARIIRLRFGLTDGKPHTLEYIAQRLGITRERVRQLQNKTLKKLKHHSRKARLRPYLSLDFVGQQSAHMGVIPASLPPGVRSYLNTHFSYHTSLLRPKNGNWAWLDRLLRRIPRRASSVRRPWATGDIGARLLNILLDQNP